MAKRNVDSDVRMKNIDALKLLEVNDFSSIVFQIVKNECNTREEFLELLLNEYPKDAEWALYGSQSP